jgi:V/A-type H+-transporting ATPase subunit F
MAGIAIVGSNDFILGFKLAGIRNTYVEENIEEKIQALLNEKEISILVIHDDEYKKLSPPMKKKLNDNMKPIVISVGKLEEEDIRDKIKRVIGIDLYKK